MLSFADFRENTRFRARSFKSLESVVQRFVIFYSDFRHHIPSLCLRGRGLKAGSATGICFAKRTSSRLSNGLFSRQIHLQNQHLYYILYSKLLCNVNRKY